MFLIDTHCHINCLNYNNQSLKLNSILKKAYKKNIKLFLSISTSIQDFYHLYKHTYSYKNILLSCGLHPNYKHTDNDLKIMKSLVKNDKVIAVGETGLDFYKNKQKKKEQIKLFEYHIYISNKIKKPIIIHNRQADNEILSILNTNKNKLCSGIIHSFTGNIDLARKLLNMGFYISFSGIITFKKSNNLRSILKFIPLNRLCIETDSPYLSPEPYRGIPNQPYLLYYIAKNIQKCLKIDFLKFTHILNKNFFTLFKINKNIYNIINFNDY
ncbi:Uncharacterized metal-dependent hydrolase YcfH [Buchnera aphidicola (Cinara kochiana kochiana)]|uniref:Uncharacterized metal-dependent hydrolase YcfH n=1 Tax=Buchnera aphidicola (Cinara kochiana kochiana) TaxID=2518976 RepID=A0A451D5L4_9GAMM|nr:TatD family hydrolase [Buchnera aphidicola]VFP81139.1 Uncharacterized metal-dependent hydrolase YcfH [Buchnera aphidicola (Cinara kochiana kochiana)]